MIIILKHKYIENEDPLLNLISDFNSFDDLVQLSNGSGLKLATLNRRLKVLRDKGLLISHRYKNNNSIWLIGNDAMQQWDGWASYQIAKYRNYKGMGLDTAELDEATSDERENMLIDIPVFDSEREDLAKDNNYAYFSKINKILKAPTHPVSQKLKLYVDELWKEYNDNC